MFLKQRQVINVELVESYGGIVAAGKEAIVIHATGGTLKPFQADKRISILSETVPAEMAVKVFKTTLNEFKSRDKYIQDDYRFKGSYLFFTYLMADEIFRSFQENESKKNDQNVV